MESKPEPASYIEQDCTFEHDGRKYTSGGAVVTPSILIAYLGKDGILQDWHGSQLGTSTRTSALAECAALFGANVCMFSALFLHTLKKGTTK